MDDAFGHYNGEWYEDHRPPVNVSRIGTFDDLQARISEELVVTLLAPGSSDPVISALHDAISVVQDQGGLDAQVALQELRGRASPTDGQEFSRQLLRCGISPLVEVEVVTSGGGPRLRIAVNRLGLLGLPDLTGATAASRAFLADTEDRLCARDPGEPDERLTAVELDARWPTLRAGHLVTGLAPEAADGIIVSRPSEFASLETALASPTSEPGRLWRKASSFGRWNR